jgi:hypothetical protein
VERNLTEPSAGVYTITQMAQDPLRPSVRSTLGLTKQHTLALLSGHTQLINPPYHPHLTTTSWHLCFICYISALHVMAALIPFSFLPLVYYLRICVSPSTSLSLYPKHQLANDVYAGRNL